MDEVETSTKRKSANGVGGNAYDSPTNKTIKDGGYSWNQYGDEVVGIGKKEPRKGQWKDKGEGKTREKGKGSRETTTEERECTSRHRIMKIQW